VQRANAPRPGFQNIVNDVNSVNFDRRRFPRNESLIEPSNAWSRWLSVVLLVVRALAARNDGGCTIRKLHGTVTTVIQTF